MQGTVLPVPRFSLPSLSFFIVVSINNVQVIINWNNCTLGSYFIYLLSPIEKEIICFFHIPGKKLSGSDQYALLAARNDPIATTSTLAALILLVR